MERNDIHIGHVYVYRNKPPKTDNTKYVCVYKHCSKAALCFCKYDISSASLQEFYLENEAKDTLVEVASKIPLTTFLVLITRISRPHMPEYEGKLW